MNTITVTSGKQYIDIDAFACAFAYQELLLAEGKKVEVILPGPVNQSVTDFLKKLAGDFFETTLKTPPKKVVVVDISELEFFPSFASSEKVVEVYDHHFGFENFWKEKIGNRAKIDPVGACATLIWEEYKKRNKGNISHASATLLALAIISNTLNFRASITKDRDHSAFKELTTHFPLSQETVKNLFLDQEKNLHQNIPQAIKSDTKTQKVASLGMTLTIGQMELWESGSFVASHLQTICDTMRSFGNSHWIFMSPSISDGKTFFISEDPSLKNILSKRFNTSFKNSRGVAPRLWLRKELLRELLPSSFQ